MLCVFFCSFWFGVFDCLVFFGRWEGGAFWFLCSVMISVVAERNWLCHVLQFGFVITFV